MNGVYSPASKYSYLRILRVFSLLYKTSKTCKEIAKITNTNVSLSERISCGDGHTWLKERYPEQFQLIKGTRVASKAINGSGNQKLVCLVSPEGILYENIFSVRKFCREHPHLDKNADSNLSRVLRGKYTNYKGWIGWIQE